MPTLKRSSLLGLSAIILLILLAFGVWIAMHQPRLAEKSKSAQDTLVAKVKQQKKKKSTKGGTGAGGSVGAGTASCLPNGQTCSNNGGSPNCYSCCSAPIFDHCGDGTTVCGSCPYVTKSGSGPSGCGENGNVVSSGVSCCYDQGYGYLTSIDVKNKNGDKYCQYNGGVNAPGCIQAGGIAPKSVAKGKYCCGSTYQSKGKTYCGSFCGDGICNSGLPAVGRETSINCPQDCLNN